MTGLVVVGARGGELEHWEAPAKPLTTAHNSKTSHNCSKPLKTAHISKTSHNFQNLSKNAHISKTSHNCSQFQNLSQLLTFAITNTVTISVYSSTNRSTTNTNKVKAEGLKNAKLSRQKVAGSVKKSGSRRSEEGGREQI